MKFAIAFALLVAACSAAPVPTAVDWTAVGGKVKAIEGIITDASTTVRNTANADNAQVGAEIGKKLDVAAAKAREQLAIATAAIQAQTLTEAQAKEIFGNLKLALADLQASLAQNVAQLSPAAQETIRSTLASALSEVETMANQIYALLRQTSTLAVNWSAVAGKVSDIEAGITASSQKVRKIANDDNAQVGAAIGTQLDGAAREAKAKLEEAAAAIAAQTLTNAQAHQIFDDLKVILAKLQESLSSNVAQLSPAAQGAIRDELQVALAKVTILANDIYGLLEGTAILAVNWSAVGGKVQEVEKAVSDASATIRQTANADNAQVGAEIGKRLDVAAVKAREQLQKASAAIQAQTLTEAQAKEIFAELENILNSLQQELSSFVNQLSPAAQSTIRNTLGGANEKVRALAQEIYALLRA
jgi:hypothetical protein